MSHATLQVAALPPNFRGVWGPQVDSDMYNIGQRLHEFDASLTVHKIELKDGIMYSIVEHCADGEERLVFRTRQLDARVVEKCQYLLHVPFERRFAEAEARELKAEEERKEKEHQDLYERIGAPMHRQLEHDGFITHRGKSYAKRGPLLGSNRAR